MTYTAHFSCYKVSLEPNLCRLADFFMIPFSATNSESLLFKPEHVSTVLKFDTPAKYVWFFKFGCVCFINFESSETYRFLKNLESTYGKIDFNLFSTYNENHNLELDEPIQTETVLTILKIYAIVLAKSTELKYLEENLDSIYDRAEGLVIDLQRGLPKPTSRILEKLNLGIVRIQLAIVNTLKVLDRPKDYDDLKLKSIYNSTFEYYGLNKRFETIQTKITTIIEIINPYQKLGFNRREARLFFLEVILIALFPLSYILDYFLPKILTFFHFL